MNVTDPVKPRLCAVNGTYPVSNRGSVLMNVTDPVKPRLCAAVNGIDPVSNPNRSCINSSPSPAVPENGARADGAS